MSAFAVRRQYNSDQIEIEERLTEELQAAKAAYDAANVQFKKIVEDCKDRRLNDRAHDLRLVGSRRAEPQLPVKDTLRTHQEAMAKYSQMLERFNNFILNGELPEPS